MSEYDDGYKAGQTAGYEAAVAAGEEAIDDIRRVVKNHAGEKPIIIRVDEGDLLKLAKQIVSGAYDGTLRKARSLFVDSDDGTVMRFDIVHPQKEARDE